MASQKRDQEEDILINSDCERSEKNQKHTTVRKKKKTMPRKSAKLGTIPKPKKRKKSASPKVKKSKSPASDFERKMQAIDSFYQAGRQCADTLSSLFNW